MDVAHDSGVVTPTRGGLATAPEMLERFMGDRRPTGGLDDVAVCASDQIFGLCSVVLSDACECEW